MRDTAVASCTSTPPSSCANFTQTEASAAAGGSDNAVSASKVSENWLTGLATSDLTADPA